MPAKPRFGILRRRDRPCSLSHQLPRALRRADRRARDPWSSSCCRPIRRGACRTPIARALEVAFFSGDVFPDGSRQFFSAVRKAPRLKWLHAFNAGVDHPIYAELLERGVRVTTSAGSAAEPIAQTAIMGLLALARGFPRWLVNQRGRHWSPERQRLAARPEGADRGGPGARQHRRATSRVSPAPSG